MEVFWSTFNILKQSHIHFLHAHCTLPGNRNNKLIKPFGFLVFKIASGFIVYLKTGYFLKQWSIQIQQSFLFLNYKFL